jgi:hypothetical protein
VSRHGKKEPDGLSRARAVSQINTHRVTFIPMNMADPTYGPIECVMPVHVRMNHGDCTLRTAAGFVIEGAGLPNRHYLLSIEPIEKP